MKPGEIVVDLFAGGGGASEGIAAAIGRDPHIAINHSRAAVAMHTINHPQSQHFCADVFEVEPRKAARGRKIGALWLSPDCTFHSRAKGGKPIDRKGKKVRSLAWVALRWIDQCRPRVIFLENVEEFQKWGPLGNDGLPIKKFLGRTFKAFVTKIRKRGYTVEWKSLVACDYGTPQRRKRLFMIARCDGEPIVWPEPTHGPGRARPYNPAADVIEWDLVCPSIFDRKKPLKPNTLRRIATGIRRFVLENAKPFLMPVTHPSDRRVHGIDEPVRTVTGAKRGELALVTPFVSRYFGQSVGAELDGPMPTVTGAETTAIVEPLLAPFVMNNMSNNAPRALSDPLHAVCTGNHKYIVAPTLIHSGNGERKGQAPRVYDIRQPLHTVVNAQRTGLVTAFITKHYGSPPHRMRTVGSPLSEPTHAVTARDHNALTACFMMKHRGTSHSASLDEPAPTVTGGGGRGGAKLNLVRALLTEHAMPAVEGEGPVLVEIGGETFAIADVGMRMLQPRELFRAQGFGDDYDIAPVLNGKPLTKTAQIEAAGNACPPQMAEALVRSNYVKKERKAA